MTDNLAKINAKGCDGTGLTEELARKLFDNPGLHLMAIVELKPGTRHIKADGQHVVDLEINTIEPVVDGKLNGRLDEHVRTIQAALYRNRALMENGEQLPLEPGDDEPTVEGVLQAGAALVETNAEGVPVLWDGDPQGGPVNAEANEVEEGDEEDDDQDEPTDDGRVVQFSGEATQ